MAERAPPSVQAPGARPPRRTRPFLNVVSNWGALLFYSVAGFFVSPFVVRSLGKEVYGTWALLGSTVGYLGLLDLGVRGAVTRFVARLHGSGEHDEARRFTSAALTVFLCTSLIALLGGVVIALILPAFEIQPELIPKARVAVLLIAATIGITQISGVYGGIVIAMQRFDLSNVATVAIEALRLVTVVLALRAGNGLVALALIQLTAGLANFWVNFVLSRRTYPELRPGLGGWERTHLREMIGFSLTTTALNASTLIILQMDAVVIGALLPVAMVTFFVVSGTLADYARKIIRAVSTTLTPRISALEGAGDVDRARREPVISARFASMALLPIAATFLARGHTFLGLWMGPEFAEPSGNVLMVLAVALWLDGAREVLASSLMGLNRHAALIRPYVVEAVLNLTLSILLAQRLGILGVALGTAIPRVIFSAAVLPRTFARVLGVSLGQLWAEAWLRPTLAVVPFLAASYAMDRMAVPENLLVFFAQVAVLLPLAVAGYWLVGLTRGERASARQRLSGALRARGA